MNPGQKLYEMCLLDIPSAVWGRAMYWYAQTGLTKSQQLQLLYPGILGLERPVLLANKLNQLLDHDEVAIPKKLAGVRLEGSPKFDPLQGWVNPQYRFKENVWNLIWDANEITDGYQKGSGALNLLPCAGTVDRFEAAKTWENLGKAAGLAKMGLLKALAEEGGRSLLSATPLPMSQLERPTTSDPTERLNKAFGPRTGYVTEQVVIQRNGLIGRLLDAIECGLLRYCHGHSAGQSLTSCPEFPFRLLDAIGDTFGVEKLGELLQQIRQGGANLIGGVLTALQLDWGGLLDIASEALTHALGSNAQIAIPVITSVVDALSKGQPGDEGNTTAAGVWLSRLISDPTIFFDAELPAGNLKEELGGIVEEALQNARGEATKELPEIAAEVGKSLLRTTAGPFAWAEKLVAFADLVGKLIDDTSEEREAVRRLGEGLGSVVIGVAEGKPNLCFDVYELLRATAPVAFIGLATALGLGNLRGKVRAIIDRIRERIKQMLIKVFTVLTKPMMKFIGSFRPDSEWQLITAPTPVSSHTLAIEGNGEGEVDVAYYSDRNGLTKTLNDWTACKGNSPEITAAIDRLNAPAVFPAVVKWGKAVLSALKRTDKNVQKAELKRIAERIKDKDIMQAISVIVQQLRETLLPEFERPITAKASDTPSPSVINGGQPSEAVATFFPLPKGAVPLELRGERDPKAEGEVLGNIPGVPANNTFVPAHLIPVGLGGKTISGNIVPTSSTVNGSFFMSCEAAVRAFLKKCKRSIEYHVMIEYPQGNSQKTPKLPSGIRITATILTGKKTRTLWFSRHCSNPREMDLKALQPIGCCGLATPEKPSTKCVD